MTLLKDLVLFRDDLYFEGAVQADWFYQPEQAATVARSFVFHGPKNHAVTQNELGGHGLMDTASFVLHLAEKMEHPGDSSALTLAIAGYGTGKSHLAVAMASLFSGEKWMPELHQQILANIAHADAEIAEAVQPLVRKPRLVLTLNGMRDFNLHYEMLRVAEKTLRMYGSKLDVLSKLNKVKEIATVFIDRSFDILRGRFESSAERRDVREKGEQLRSYLLSSLNEQNGIAFDIINEVYTEFNGHPIRLDEGVSAGAVLETILEECCGLHGKYDGIVILFDEFGRFLEYVSSNPAAAGDSALQQIFEAVQNAEGDIQFVGFIQSDIKSYLQRVDKSSNISRYIDRYDAGEKVYLSSNLETIFANLLEKKDETLYNQVVSQQMTAGNAGYRQLHANLSKWLPLHGIWQTWEDFERIILRKIYPLHPVSTYLLCNLTDWLQSRSSLTLLSEQVRLMGDTPVIPGQPLPFILPVTLLKGSFFEELLNAEEQGRQRSQFCILLNNIYRKFDSKLTDESRKILLANLIIRICRFHFEQRSELIEALCICAGLTASQTQSALQLLEDEYAVLSYDDRLICFDFVADSVGANEFRNFLRTAQNRVKFSGDMLAQNDIQELAEVTKPLETDFGANHGIQTREWMFIQRMDTIENVGQTLLTRFFNELKTHTLPSTERGMVIWVYAAKETSSKQIEALTVAVNGLEKTQAMTIFLLDDADGSLRDAIISYRVLANMNDEDKLRYQRFYVDAYEKAKERVHLLFADLKQERKVVTENGVEVLPKRIKGHLTSIFETVYPKVTPFDFEGFDTKSGSGAAYKNFCTIMKWILMDHMNYTSLKSQSTEIRNRVESLLGPKGIYSWKVLNDDYKNISPVNGAVKRIYDQMELLMNKNKLIPFKQLMNLLTAAPYGMNEYAVFLLIGLFSENFSYTTKLLLDDVKYSTDTWAEQVLFDKKYDVKLFAKTRLLLIDVGKTIEKYRQLFLRIKKNTDISRVAKYRQDLEMLVNEEAIPEELEAEHELAVMRLAEGEKALKVFDDRMNKIYMNLEKAKEKGDAYGALQTALDAQKVQYEQFSSNDWYIIAASQTDELDRVVSQAKMIARKSFDNGWIANQSCTRNDQLNGFMRFIEKACDLFGKYQFVQEAAALEKQGNKEIERIQMRIDQEKLITRCDTYLASSQIRKGMTQANFAAYLEDGREILKQYDNVDYSIDSLMIKQHDLLNIRLSQLEAEMRAFKDRLSVLWTNINDINTIDDARHVHASIETVLESGLTDRDREEFEQVDTFIQQFLTDMRTFDQLDEESVSCLTRVYDELNKKYLNGEVSMTHVIDGVYRERLQQLRKKEMDWSQRYLSIYPENMSQAQLDKWKQSTKVLPDYISGDTIAIYQEYSQKVEAELAKQRVDYIMLLFSRLSEAEKKACMERIRWEC